MSKRPTPPSVADPEVQRIVQDIYDRLGQMHDAVNQAQKAQPSNTEGKAGDIRVVKGADGKHYVEVRTDEGWARSSTDTFTLQPKETK